MFNPSITYELAEQRRAGLLAAAEEARRHHPSASHRRPLRSRLTKRLRSQAGSNT